MHATRRLSILAAAILLGLGLQAQEPWKGGFKLTAATYSGAENADLGQGRAYGLAIFSTYPLGKSSGIAFEGGYRFLPTVTHWSGQTAYDDKSDGYYGSAFYQHRFGYEAFHIQGGLRVSQFVAARRTNFYPGDGTSVLTKSKGPYATTIKPVIGAGLWLNAKFGLELNLSPTDMKNVDGVSKTGNLIEVALLIHM